MRFLNSKVRLLALGIGAASFWSGAEKDIAESPTAELEAETERPKKEDYMTTSCWGDEVFNRKKSCGFVDGGFEEFRV